MAYRLAVDIGGTFTDLVLMDDRGEVSVSKVPTTPEDLAVGILQAVDRVGVSLADVQYLAHGTTIALNTLLQRNGARVGLLTTQGFRDVLEIMRTNRPDMYNLQQDKPEPLVPRFLRLEISERTNAEGDEVAPVRPDEVIEAVRRMKEHGVEALAVCLLFSYANPSHERQVKSIVEEAFPGLPVAISSDLTREWREYERTSTTVINAYTQPAMEDYLATVDARLAEAGFRHDVMIMQSNGGIMAARDARHQPVRTIMSGPAGGVIAGEHLAKITGFGDLITFDMGGTSADICLITEGRATVRSVQEIERLPVLQPSIDITSIGAGGGSIAWIDPGNALRVGPQSAGAIPGPVCYGRGGTRPTVTDANLVLGYIDPNYFLGGRIRLDLDAARQAIEEQIAGPLGLSLEEAADGIVQIVNANMLRALRKVSVERGYDPRDFALLAFGGAGGLHAAQLAGELGLNHVIIPRVPGVTSALGMLVADVRHDYVITYVQPVRSADPDAIERHYRNMEAAARAQLRKDGMPDDAMVLHRTADIRYSGQEYTLNAPVPNEPISADVLGKLHKAFHELHERMYGYRIPEEDSVFINLRLTAVGRTRAPSMTGGGSAAVAPEPKGSRTAYFREQGRVNCPVYERAHLAVGASLAGPAIIEEPESTVLIPPGARATIDSHGNILVHL